jgi:hypothetical protein
VGIVGGELFSVGLKQPVHKADHSSPSSALVKNVWSYTLTSPIHIHGMVLKHEMYYHGVVHMDLLYFLPVLCHR